MKGIIYNSLGKIIRAVDAPESMLLDQIHGLDEFLFYGDGNAKLDYINENTLVPRPLQLTILNKTTLNADGVDIVTISNAPQGTFTAFNLTTNDTITGEINGTDTFSTTISGTYEIKIESFPYLDFVTTVEAI